jgi:hypothetical protein
MGESNKKTETQKRWQRTNKKKERKLYKKTIKEESKIKVLAHKLLASTLSYLMLTHW